MDAEAKRLRQLELAHRLMEVVQSEAWKTVIVPYFESERAVMIEMMASMTDSLQLMRYAGSIQTLTNAVLGLEAQVKRVIEANMEKKMKKF